MVSAGPQCDGLFLNIYPDGAAMKRRRNDPDMLEEYDFSDGIRGKCAKRYAEGTNVVVVEPEVARFFPDHDSVNQALRHLAADRDAARDRTIRSSRPPSRGAPFGRLNSHVGDWAGRWQGRTSPLPILLFQPLADSTLPDPLEVPTKIHSDLGVLLREVLPVHAAGACVLLRAPRTHHLTPGHLRRVGRAVRESRSH